MDMMTLILLLLPVALVVGVLLLNEMGKDGDPMGLKEGAHLLPGTMSESDRLTWIFFKRLNK